MIRIMTATDPKVITIMRGEAKAGWTADVQRNSGTCLGRRRRGWVLGAQNQSFPLAANMHYPSSRREYANVGGMVS